MSGAANPSQDLSIRKQNLECKIWILSVMHMASYNQQKCLSCDVDAALLCTVWMQVFGHK